jgi:hypothetical protein
VLRNPILQLHHKTKNGVRTISPLGSFSGWFFSEELYNAEKYGYSFKVIRGYTFEKDYIFKGYVKDLYNLRLNYPKTDPMNYTAKLLLNSLYGRFGMNDNFPNIFILNKEEYQEIESDPDLEVIEVIPLTDTTPSPHSSVGGHSSCVAGGVGRKNINEKYLVQWNNPYSYFKTRLDGSLKETHNVNIAIAASVTAYARIHMSQFKNNPTLPNLYYTDTDSLYFDGPIDDSFISNTKLGKLKLEGIYDQAIFLAPKVYALKNSLEEIIKIKGLTKDAIIKNNISLNSLELLLNKDYKLAFNQRKWFRNISQANINILEQTYTLKATGNKREMVYNDKDLLVATQPILIKKMEE